MPVTLFSTTPDPALAILWGSGSITENELHAPGFFCGGDL
jgi:hypothetical protein